MSNKYCDKHHDKHLRNMKKLKDKGACGKNAKGMIDEASNKSKVDELKKIYFFEESKPKFIYQYLSFDSSGNDHVGG